MDVQRYFFKMFNFLDISQLLIQVSSDTKLV